MLLGKHFFINSDKEGKMDMQNTNNSGGARRTISIIFLGVLDLGRKKSSLCGGLL